MKEEIDHIVHYIKVRKIYLVLKSVSCCVVLCCVVRYL